MADTLTDVLVAAYQDIDTASKDFDALVASVKEKQVAIEGVILVTHAEDGSVSVRQTGDHQGCKGAGWGRGTCRSSDPPPTSGAPPEAAALHRIRDSCGDRSDRSEAGRGWT